MTSRHYVQSRSFHDHVNQLSAFMLTTFLYEKEPLNYCQVGNNFNLLTSNSLMAIIVTAECS